LYIVIYKNNGNICVGSNTNIALISSNSIPFKEKEWQFIAVQGSTANINGNLTSNLYLYSNGQLTGNVNFSNTAYNFSDINLTLGADVAGSNVCTGFMDELRLSTHLNRYDVNNINIEIPTEPFSRKSIDNTPILWGFESMNNESSLPIIFKSINSKSFISDMSRNQKKLELIEYSDSQLTVIDSSLITNQNFSVKLIEPF